MTNLSIIWSVTITVLGQMRALIQCYKYELVLTPTECSTFYGANVTRWKKIRSFMLLMQSSGIQIIPLGSKNNKNTH